MPINKDFKRLVRGRMRKTGESYTAARAILLNKPAPQTPAETPVKVEVPVKVDYAKLAGMSNEAVKAKTGCDWERWVMALDYNKAHTWSHREIAEYVHDTFKVPDWWSQMVTVGYERIRGLREVGQRREGSYEASRSKTVPVPVSRLYRAFRDSRLRAKWLPGIALTVRKATPNKSVRMTWDDGTSVEVWLISKGTRKASATIAHRRLTTKADADRRKAYWGERLAALAQVLTA